MGKRCMVGFQITNPTVPPITDNKSAESEDCEVVVQQGSNRKPYLNFETDDEGHPILPERSQWPKKGMDKKALVRSYVAVAYRKWMVLMKLMLVTMRQ